MDKKINFNTGSAEPLYRQLASFLRDRIIRGEILPGEKLPSENEMLDTFNVGRMTIRNALALLVSEGLLSKSQGKGTFCTGSKASEKALDIEVLLNMTDAYFVPYYVHGISEILSGSNSNFLISNTQDNDETLCSLLENIAVKGSSGLILQYTGPAEKNRYSERLDHYLDLLTDRGLPIVILDGYVDNPGVSCLTVDEAAGGRRAAEHLAAFGHKKCAVIVNGTHRDSRLRLEGFEAGSEMFGMKPPVTICDNGLWEEQLIQAVRSGITGVFAYNDSAAIKCLQILRRESYRVPEDVSIIGYDDTFLAASSGPPLTSIIHPKEAIGRDAANLLLNKLHTGDLSPENKTYDIDLVMRGSCGPAPKTTLL